MWSLQAVPQVSFSLYLTIFLHATVLLTLSLAVELVAIALAKAGFVGHTQTSSGVEGPDGWLACAGLG